MSLLLYLHGFNSSPDSQKARISADWFAEHAPDMEFFCPQLPPFANAAMHRLRTLMDDNRDRSIYLIGSSMGGFFATYLIEHYGHRGVLINPAVNPALGMDRYIGINTHFHSGDEWRFEPHHVEEYRRWDRPIIVDKRRYHVLLQTGDEVLDYRHAEERYRGCSMLVEQGGDHSFINFADHLGDIYRFLMA